MEQAPDGTINVNAESNQPQDIEVEYRFAGYYENETPPTLDELQDPKYLNNVIVHFEASATGGTPTDPNPVDPGDDDNNTTDPNPVDPGDDDNNPTDPNDDNDPTDTDDPTNGEPEQWTAARSNYWRQHRRFHQCIIMDDGGQYRMLLRYISNQKKNK